MFTVSPRLYPPSMDGVPVVGGGDGDHLIVPHISFESDDIQAVLDKLKELKVNFSRNVSIPDGKGLTPVTQYFIRDPDGYYIELCNCDILTNFCLGKDEIGIHYNEVVEHVDISHLFKLAILAQKAIDTDDQLVIPKQSEWAKEEDKIKLKNMLSRAKIYGDLMQGETEEIISMALRQANKKGKETFFPPAFFKEGVTRYQPAVYTAPKSKHQAETERFETTPKSEKTFEASAIQMFRHFDKDNSGTLTTVEFEQILKSLHQSPSEETLNKMLSSIDVNNDGSIDLEEFLKLVNSKPFDDESQYQAFFALLDLDGNNMITCPELAMVIRSLNLPLHDSHVENLFIEADLDGNGVLSLEEVKRFVLG